MSESPLCCMINGILECTHCHRRYCGDHADKHLYVRKESNHDQFVDCLCGAVGGKRWRILSHNIVTP